MFPKYTGEVIIRNRDLSVELVCCHNKSNPNEKSVCFEALSV